VSWRLQHHTRAGKTKRRGCSAASRRVSSCFLKASCSFMIRAEMPHSPFLPCFFPFPSFSSPPPWRNRHDASYLSLVSSQYTAFGMHIISTWAGLASDIGSANLIANGFIPCTGLVVGFLSQIPLGVSELGRDLWIAHSFSTPVHPMGAIHL
jgi:hypothetical protein